MESDDTKELIKITSSLETKVDRLMVDHSELKLKTDKMSEELGKYRHTSNALALIGSMVLSIVSVAIGANIDDIVGWFRK